MFASSEIVLASRSPQRRRLLGQLVGDASLRIVPPDDPTEPGFDDCHAEVDIESRLRQTALGKLRNVSGQLSGGVDAIVVAADTVIIAFDDSAGSVVLGQPPEPEWQPVVRTWFRELLLGRTHVAATAVAVAHAGSHDALESARFRVVRSEVTFHDDGERWLEWYIESGEPRGKAGGYGIQGLGSIFVASVSGSISNVVGLPQRELLELLGEFD